MSVLRGSVARTAGRHRLTTCLACAMLFATTSVTAHADGTAPPEHPVRAEQSVTPMVTGPVVTGLVRQMPPQLMALRTEEIIDPPRPWAPPPAPVVVVAPPAPVAPRTPTQRTPTPRGTKSIVSRTVRSSRTNAATRTERTRGIALPATSGTVAEIIAYAHAQLGKPYLWGATGPDAFDCSGLVFSAYRAAGIPLPRTSAEQIKVGSYLPPSAGTAALRPGDLVFWATDPANLATVHHVAIYLGDGMVLQAPHTGDVVQISTIWLTGYAGAVRIVG